MTDGDRAAAATGRRRGRRLPRAPARHRRRDLPARLRRGEQRGALVRPPRPVGPRSRARVRRSLADAWDAYRRLNQVFADAVADVAPEGAAVLCRTTTCAWWRRTCATGGPTSRACTSATRRSRPRCGSAPCPPRRRRSCSQGMAAHRACGFHSAALGRRLHGVRARARRPRAADVRVAARLGPGRHPGGGRVPRVRRGAGGARGGRRRPRRDRTRRPGRAVEEHPARVPRLRPAPRGASGAPRAGGVRGRRLRVASGRARLLAYRERHRAGRHAVNERWGTDDWQPIVLDVEDDYPRSVALLRRADVLLVNPIRDGLNLVASEGALVNDRDAVLALSPEAGAWERLQSAAVPVPPFDLVGTAEALHRSLTMPAAERAERAALAPLARRGPHPGPLARRPAGRGRLGVQQAPEELQRALRARRPPHRPARGVPATPRRCGPRPSPS